MNCIGSLIGLKVRLKRYDGPHIEEVSENSLSWGPFIDVFEDIWLSGKGQLNYKLGLA